MSDSVEINNQIINQFNKIKLLDDIANQFAWYGVQCGYEQLMDYIDMNCGAIPEGEIGQVIDFNSPHQFLSLYTQIAEDRFAFTITELLKLNSSLLQPICDSCFNAGKGLSIQNISQAKDAYNVINSYVLDGMPCDTTKEIIEESEEKITWKKLIDTHEKSWNKAGGKLENYYKIQESFVNGLFSNSNFKYSIYENTTFTIEQIK